MSWRNNKNKLEEKYGNKCFYCKCSLEEGEVHLDHYVSKYYGGSNRVDNLRLSCRDCNMSKSKHKPSEWLERLEKRLRSKIQQREALNHDPDRLLIKKHELNTDIARLDILVDRIGWLLALGEEATWEDQAAEVEYLKKYTENLSNESRS